MEGSFGSSSKEYFFESRDAGVVLDGIGLFLGAKPTGAGLFLGSDVVLVASGGGVGGDVGVGSFRRGLELVRDGDCDLGRRADTGVDWGVRVTTIVIEFGEFLMSVSTSLHVLLLTSL